MMPSDAHIIESGFQKSAFPCSLMRLKGVLVFLSGCALCLISDGVFAQGEQIPRVNSQQWFPLELGNYWHYRSEAGGFTTDFILATKRDTVVETAKWTEIDTVYCGIGPHCPDLPLWYHFAEDHYLLLNTRPDLVSADTVLITTPHSVFLVMAWTDTLRTWLTSDPVVVELLDNPDGQPEDSTNFLLSIYANVLFEGQYIYKIGKAEGLVGALVNGREYADTGLIRNVVLTHSVPRPGFDKATVDVYPNPSRGARTSIVVQSGEAGLYQIDVYDTLGRYLFVSTQLMPTDQRWNVNVEERSRMTSGVYFIRLSRDGVPIRIQTWVVAP
jgi:hypothetical protein